MGRGSAKTFTAALCAAGLLAGCGGEEDDYANQERPPAPIFVGGSINDGRLAISPRSFGAGPIELKVANQTDAARVVTLETNEIGGGPGVTQTTGPINPGDTATIKVDLPEGSYEVTVDGGGIGAAALEVGAARPSAQDELLQP